MKEIFQEYGGILITVVAIVALIAVIGVLVGSGGPVQTAFNDLITGFVQKAGVVSSQATQATQAAH